MTTILKSKQLRAFPFSGSAVITGSLNVTNTVTASYFKGDGSSITNIAYTSSILEYYVDKRFSGSCEITIIGKGLISSSNSNYLTQFSSSQAGNPNKPYPDPWSANIAASASIAAGFIGSARIIIKTGNTYTYGSSTLSQNGDLTGSASNNLKPDISISQVNYNSGSFYLIQPNIEYYFEPSCSLYNINKSWQQMLAYYTSSNWNSQESFKITGKGKFVNVYGQNEGFSARWGVIAAPSCNITLQADHIIQNMWNGWELIGQQVDIDIDKLWSYNGFTFNVGDGGYNWPSASLSNKNINKPIINLKINDFRYGINQFTGISPHADDFWRNITIHNTFGSDINIDINRFLATCITYDNGGLFQYYIRNTSYETGTRILSASNANINVNMNYISASYTSSVGNSNYSAGGPINNMKGMISPNDYGWDNNFVNINVKKFDSWGLGFMGFTENSTNNTVIINCDEYINYITSSRDGNDHETNRSFDFILVQNISSSLTDKKYINNKVTISGNYINYAPGQTLINFGHVSSGSNNNFGYTLFLNKFNAYNVASGSVLKIKNGYYPYENYNYSTGSNIVMQNSLLYQSSSNTILNITDKSQKIIVNNTIMNTDFPSNVSAQGSFDLNTNLDKIIY